MVYHARRSVNSCEMCWTTARSRLSPDYVCFLRQFELTCFCRISIVWMSCGSLVMWPLQPPPGSSSQQTPSWKIPGRHWERGWEQPGTYAQCPPRLMRAHTFELSTEVFHFYGSAEVLRKRQEFYGRAIFLRNSDGLFYGRARFLRKKLATVSTEQLFF